MLNYPCFAPAIFDLPLVTCQLQVHPLYVALASPPNLALHFDKKVYQIILPFIFLIFWKFLLLTASVRTGHGTTDWFQIGKRVNQGCILSSVYLTYVQSTSCEMPGWRKHKLESRLPGEISITSGTRQMTPPFWEKVKN